jgi:hypothetical protein
MRRKVALVYERTGVVNGQDGMEQALVPAP